MSSVSSARQQLFEYNTRHPFLLNPDAWFAEHETSLEDCFACTTEKRPVRIGCVDEGCIHKVDVGLLGAGILSPLEKVTARLKELGMNIESVCSHEGCGACKLYAQKMGIDGNSDDCGKEWAEKLATSVGAVCRHIDAKHMDRPADHHCACVAYIDLTLRLQDPVTVGLPLGFKLTHLWQESEMLVECADTIIGIALGGHGLGDMITTEHPFTLILFRNPQDMAVSQQLEQALREHIEKTYNGRVRLVAHDAPNN